MAVGTTTESDVKRSIENLSNELDNVFKKIQSEAFKLFDGLASAPDGLTKGFKDAVKEINNMSSVADRYNAYYYRCNRNWNSNRSSSRRDC